MVVFAQILGYHVDFYLCLFLDVLDDTLWRIGKESGVTIAGLLLLQGFIKS